MPSVLASNEARFPAGMSAEEPSLVFDPSAFGQFNDSFSVLARFLRFVQRDIRRQHVPVSRVEIRGSADPEDDTRQLIVRLWMRGSDSEARQYHHDLGTRVDRWLIHLPKEQRLSFITRLSFQTRREAIA